MRSAGENFSVKGSTGVGGKVPTGIPDYAFPFSGSYRVKNKKPGTFRYRVSYQSIKRLRFCNKLRECLD